MKAMITFVLQSIVSITCILAAFPEDMATIVGKGCENKVEFTTTFLTASGDICTDCKFCSGSRDAHLFESSVENVCTECTSADVECDTLEIVTSFNEAWTPTSFHLVSAAKDDADPSQVTMLGSKDMADWVTLFDLDDKSSPLFPTRKTRESYTVTNSEEFKYLSLRLKRNDTSTSMNIGTYGILQDYLKQCSTNLFKDIVGFNPTDIVTEKGKKLTTIAKPSNEFVLSFKLKLTGRRYDQSNIIRFTSTDNQNGAYGDRWLFMGVKGNSYTMNFAIGSTSNPNDHFPGGFPLAAQKWHDIKVEAIGDEIKLYINDELKGTKPNTNRPQLDKVDVYTGDNHLLKAHAIIRDFNFTQYTSNPFGPALDGWCRNINGNADGHNNRKYLGLYTDSSDCLDSCYEYFKSNKYKHISGCQHDHGSLSNGQCYVYDSESYIAGSGSGGSEVFCWLVANK